MAHVLFVSVPLTGHLSPAVAVASALARAASTSATGGGAVATVRFAGLGCSAARIKAAGLEFVDLGDLSPEEAAHMDNIDKRMTTGSAARGLYGGGATFMEWEMLMTPRLLGALRAGAAPGTTHIATDFATIAGMDAAEALGLPLVVLHQVPLGMALALTGNNHCNMPSHVPIELPCPLLQAEQLTPLQRAANPVLKRAAACLMERALQQQRAEARAALGLPLGARGGVPSCGPIPGAVPFQCHIVSGSTQLEVERPLPPGWHISGHHNIDYSGANFPVAFAPGDPAASKVQAFIEAADAAGEPVVYVAMGTIARPTPQQLAALGGALAALRGARAIWALRKEFQQDVPPEALAAAQEGRLLLLGYAPQQAILSHPSVKVFVTHGGLNSTYEGAAAGKAMVVMPFFADQPVNAQHVVNKGLGAMVDPSKLTATALAATVTRLIGDGATQRRAAAVGAELRKETGAATAACAILQFVRDTAAAAAVPLPGTPPPCCGSRAVAVA